MNWMRQHEEAIQEIDAYYSFAFWAQLKIGFRSVCPRLLLQRIRASGFRWRLQQETPESQKRDVDMLCSEKDKSNVFYDVFLASHPMTHRTDALHALSKHLATKFALHDWRAVEEVHRIHEGSVPAFGFFKHMLPFMVFVLAIVGLLVNFSPTVGDKTVGKIDTNWALWTYFHALYVVCSLGFYLCHLAWRRYKLKRSGSVLKYLVIRKTQ